MTTNTAPGAVDPRCIKCGNRRSDHNYFGGFGYLCHNGSNTFLAEPEPTRTPTPTDAEVEAIQEAAMDATQMYVGTKMVRAVLEARTTLERSKGS